MTLHTSDLCHVPAALVVAGDNDRLEFEQDKLELLAQAIAAGKSVPPPLYRPLPDGRFQIVAGERRTRAMRDILKWELIPAIVRDMSDEEASEIMLAENTNRVDLNPIEEAKAYQKRIDRFGWSIAQVAAKAGKSESRVRELLPVLKLTDDLQQLIAKGQFPIPFARLLALEDLDVNRQRIALRVFNGAKTMSLYRWREVVQQLVAEQSADQQLDFLALFEQLSAIAQTTSPTKGRKARTGVSAARTLPPIRRAKDDTMSPIFARYIADLQTSGHLDAAGAVGNLYNTFVALGWITVNERDLSTSGAAGLVEEELHEEPLP